MRLRHNKALTKSASVLSVVVEPRMASWIPEMRTRVKYNWQALKHELKKHIEQGDGVNSLAWRYGVTTGAVERALKKLGLETFDQRYQRLTAGKKKKGSARPA